MPTREDTEQSTLTGPVLANEKTPAQRAAIKIMHVVGQILVSKVDLPCSRGFHLLVVSFL